MKAITHTIAHMLNLKKNQIICIINVKYDEHDKRTANRNENSRKEKIREESNQIKLEMNAS